MNYLLKKLIYGGLVLFGVVTVVFFLFNLSPGDPARNIAGENASEEVLAPIRRKLDLDLPKGQRYALYLNDLSPLSILDIENSESRIYFDPQRYSGLKLFPVSAHRALVLKWPYMKRSFLSDKNVSTILAEVIPGTVILAVVSIGLALIIGLLLGIFAAIRKDTFYDRFILFLSAIGMSGPSFFVAILVAWAGAILWREHMDLPLFPLLWIAVLISFWYLLRKKWTLLKRWNAGPVWLFVVVSGFALLLFVRIFFHEGQWIYSVLTQVIQLPGTGLNMTGSLYSVDLWEGQYMDLKNMILPVITLTIRPLAVIVQLTRSSMLEVLSQDFIRTARAKGLTESRIIFRHALRNALNPVVTAVSGWFASLLAGAVFVEFVFGWKGLGQEMFTAIEKQDLPVVMGGVIVIAAAFVIVNLLVDIIYGWIDPRVRME